MFLGNLSTANEHKARKKGNTKKKVKSDEDDSNDVDNSGTVARRLKVAALPVLYKSDSIPRDVLLDFLKTCIQMMLDSESVNEIVQDTFDQNIGLNQAAINFQRDVLENNFRIERDFGCKYLSTIPVKHEGDVELVDNAKEFMFTAICSYMKALRARSARYKSTPALKPKANAPLSRTTILEFFEGCNALMSMPETKEELKTVFKTTGSPPGPRVVEMQRSILVLLGYDADYGVSCLNKINQDFPGDRELIGKMQYYAVCAEVACQEATFTEEQKEQFYSQIPPLMQHFPHIFVMQQRMQHQQMQMQMQQQMAQSSSAAQAARLSDIEALKQSGVFGLLSSPEGRLRIQELAGRVQSSKQRMEEEVPQWSAEKKTQFFESFAEHPVLVKLTESGADASAKIHTFLDMSEGDLDQMMSLLLVVGDNSALLQQEQQVAGQSAEAMKVILATMGSLTKFNKFGPPPPQHAAGDASHGHDYGHSHAHGESCSQHPVYRSNMKDVSYSAADTMDR